MDTAYIYDALRTPRGKGKPAKDGKGGGALTEIAPQDLIAGLVSALDARNETAISKHTERLVLGCVGQVEAQGGHIALVCRRASELPDRVAVKSVNNYCVSGLSAVIEVANAARAGEDGIMLAGGVECLSQVGFLADRGHYYSDPALIQELKWAPPIMGAELIATMDGFTKEDLDQLTLASHQKAASAWREGHYDKSVAPVRSGGGEVVLEQDELIRADLTIERLTKMRPAFAEQGAAGFDTMMMKHYPEVESISHIHSLANCPGLADGASLVVIGNEEAGCVTGLKPMAKILSHAEVGGDPVLQFGAGMAAMDRALTKAGLRLNDIDRIEFMEAFAAVPMKFYRDYDVDPDKVNVNGGHLAMGHPMGATGGILLTTLVHELERCAGQYGLVVAHAGIGIGAAMVIERV